MTIATVTSSTAVIPVMIGIPSSVPRTSASKLPVGLCGSTISPSAVDGPNGTIKAAIANAAGVEITEAIKILPSAFGITGPSIPA